MDTIISYDIPYVLPLTLNMTACILNQTNEIEELIHQVILTSMEAAVLKILLDAAPRMTPYEDVVQVLRAGERIEVQGRSLQKRNVLLAPTRALLTGLDTKIQLCNLHILAVYETGYLVCPLHGEHDLANS